MNYLRQSTLCFFLKENQILLAMKKRGFGKNRWNGVGGKPKKDENIIETAIRESKEEIEITPKKLNQVAILDFYFQNKTEWNQQVLVFTSTEWEGEPKETEEMKPKWFDLDKIPFDSMWPDDIFWLPSVLSGKKIKAEFIFDKKNIILNKKINEIQHF